MFKRKPIVTAIALSIAQSTHADLTSGLVAYYPFNGNAKDESGNGNDGNVYGAILTTDRFGNENSAFDFDGINNYIEVHSSYSLDVTNNFSIAGWIFVSNANYGTSGRGIIEYGPDSYSTESYALLVDGHNLPTSKAKVVFNTNWPYNEMSCCNAPKLFDLGVWTHVAMTYQSSAVRIYVNGLLDTGFIGITNLPLSNGRVLRIGDNQSGVHEFFDGKIDDVRIYNRVLSDADVQELYQENTIKQLTISKQGTGNGSVSSNPSGISCGSDCNENYAFGTVVTLNATPTSGSIFSGFSGDPDCADKQVTMNAAKTCIATFNLAPPIAVTNAVSNISVTSATLNGSVISSGATATVTFDFGNNLNYGQTVAATPSQVYSSSAVAVSANKLGLVCNTNYHVRTKAVNSGGTGLGLDQTFTTNPCVINTWLYPGNPTVLLNEPFTLEVTAKSGVKIGNYEFVLTIDPNVLRLDTSYCNQGICAGNDSLTNNIVYVNNTTGTITIIGQGGETGTGNDLQLLVIHLRSKLIPTLTQVSLVTNKLETLYGDVIGLEAKGATVKVSPGICGNADGNNAVNIVDALSIARKLVNLPPPPTIDTLLSDTNENDRVDISDALFIARYSVGLVLPPEACAIGQPL